jgi:hypothetical protein
MENTTKYISISDVELQVKQNPNGWTLPLEKGLTLNRYVATITHGIDSQYIEAFLETFSKVEYGEGIVPTIGGWTDTATGVNYIDFGFSTNNKALALQTGENFGQFAIFDLEEFEEIRIGTCVYSK